MEPDLPRVLSLLLLVGVGAPLGAVAQGTVTSTPAAVTPEVATASVAVDVATSTVPARPRPTVKAEDARGLVEDPDGVTGADVALFVPRLVLFPLRLVMLGVGWPLEQGIRAAEEHHVPEHVIDLLYNDERTAAILPIVTLFSGQGVSAGATIFHDDLFGNDERISLSAQFGGRYVQSWNGSFVAERFAGTPLWLEAQMRYELEPDLYFEGVGNRPEAPIEAVGLDPYAASHESRFRQERLLARMRAGTVFGDGWLKLGVSGIYNHRRYATSEDGVLPLDDSDRSITSVYDTSRLVGFDDGTDLIEVTGDLILDLRDKTRRAPTGLYLEAFGGGVPPQSGYQFVHWGVEAAGFIELFAETRVLVLRAAMEAVEGELDEIPFGELPRLGGGYRLRGHQLDSLRGAKSMLGTIEYRWPVHQHVAGVAFGDLGRVGNDYDALFGGAGSGPWEFGVGGGIALTGERGDWLRLDVSYGDGVYIFITTGEHTAQRGRATRL